MSTQLKKTLLCLLLASALLLCACGGDDDSSAPGDSSASDISALSSSLADESGSGASNESSVSAEPESAAPALPVLDELPLGTFAYLDTEGLFPDERAPQLELLEGNRAAFRVNTGTEVGTAEGSVQFSGSDLTVYIESIDVEEEFWGYNLTSLTFRVLDENQLEYTGSPFGLTQRQMVFARQSDAAAGSVPLAQGSGSAPVTAVDPSQNMPQDVSGPVGTVTDVSAASDMPDASVAEDAGTDESQPEEEEDTKVPVVEPDKAPPETVKKGDSFRLDSIDPDSLVYDAMHFDAMPSQNGESVTLTALLEGDTTLSYATTQGEFEGQTRQFAISVVERGVRLWLVIAIAAASAAVGGVGAVVLVTTLKRRKDNKEQRLAAAAEKKEQKAAAAVRKKEDRAEKAEEQKEKKAETKKKRKAKQDAKKAKAQEKKAAKLAKKKDKKATAAAKKAAKAAQEAEKAAEKAAAASEKIGRLSGQPADEKPGKDNAKKPPKEDKPAEEPEAPKAGETDE